MSNPKSFTVTTFRYVAKKYINIRITEEAVRWPQYSSRLLYSQHNGHGVYYGLSTASEVFLIFTTQLYQYFSVFFLSALFSDKPEVFLPKYSQTAILHADTTFMEFQIKVR